MNEYNPKLASIGKCGKLFTKRYYFKCERYYFFFLAGLAMFFLNISSTSDFNTTRCLPWLSSLPSFSGEGLKHKERNARWQVNILQSPFGIKRGIGNFDEKVGVLEIHQHAQVEDQTEH
jgi:hypothetical protein